MAYINRQIAIVIAESDCFLAAGLAAWLKRQPRFRVAAVAVNCPSLPDFCARHHPDVIILDSGLLPIVEELLLTASPAAIILYERRGAPALCNTLAAAVSGIVYMGQPEHILLQAIRDVYYGGTYHCPITRQLMQEQAMQKPAALLPKKPVLSSTQAQVLQYLAEEKSSKQIAALMCLAPASVASIRATLRQKTKTATTAGLIAYALQDGLIRMPH